MRIIPAIDIIDGKCVRLTKGDYATKKIYLKSDLFKGIKENEFMYLVHSFYAEKCMEGIASTDYGIEYAAALQKNNFYGVQFHPEKSGIIGSRILQNFLNL